MSSRTKRARPPAPPPAGTLWYLLPGAMPVRAGEARGRDGATHWCREGDDRWRPIDELEFAPPEEGGST